MVMESHKIMFCVLTVCLQHKIRLAQYSIMLSHRSQCALHNSNLGCDSERSEHLF